MGVGGRSSLTFYMGTETWIYVRRMDGFNSGWLDVGWAGGFKASLEWGSGVLIKEVLLTCPKLVDQPWSALRRVLFFLSYPNETDQVPWCAVGLLTCKFQSVFFFFFFRAASRVCRREWVSRFQACWWLGLELQTHKLFQHFGSNLG